jgi:hypothetical protein
MEMLGYLEATAASPMGKDSWNIFSGRIDGCQRHFERFVVQNKMIPYYRPLELM